MSSIEFPYTTEKSRIFGNVKRPRMSISVFSKLDDNWVMIDDVLADTGADLTVLPRFIGELLIEDITTGEYTEIKGVVPTSVLIAFIHRDMRVKIDEKEFRQPIAIADSNNVPSIFGRANGLDLFDANFIRGEKLTLSWDD
ncbi:hypothetical protein BEH94_03245 [Candidatus Altiarchaeales archaeon WOR_SM1_SCG]|nr:hypothetical protein BEH94_03245 [Candidatus Altiarchaeales archaeon WOR_SM1_SCG]